MILTKGGGSMDDDWIKCTVADACSSIDYGLTASASDNPVGPRFLRITDIVQGHIVWDSVPYVEQNVGKKYRLHDGDIVLARTGASTGASAYVKSPPPAVFASYLVRLQATPEFDALFLAYYLKSTYFLDFIHSILGDKSAQPNASASTMTKAPFCAPKDIKEQRRIAHILGTLDDKIENNRKTAKTLEAMAQAIFKSWFVDFDPVRAKMAGESRDSICKRLKLTPEILDLFPDRLVDSELGEIPEGWHNKAISEIVKRVSVGTKYDTKKVFEIGKVPVLDQGKSGIIGYHNGTPDIHASPTNPIIIFANHTCYMRLIPYDFSVIQNVLPFYGDGVDTIWAYFATRDKISFSEYKGHWPDFILEPVIVPSKALTTYFRTIISDLISAIFVADAMNEPISKTRDTLLPKLISGELRVSDPALLI